MQFKVIFSASLLVLASACAAPEYRGSVITFGEAAQAAATAQTARLSALTDRQLQEIRGQLAQDRVKLTYSEACIFLAAPGTPIEACSVTLEDGTPISQPETFTSILVLNKAIGAYGAALATLAADTSQEGAVFNKSLTNLAVALNGLDTAVGGTANNAAQLQSAATQVGGIGNAVFAASRVSKLREIISAADPLIQQAVQQLGRASEVLTFNEVTTALERAEGTQRKLRAAIDRGAATGVIAKLQSQLFADVEALKRTAAVRDTYAAIGKSHAALAEASRADVSLSDLKASIRELAQLAKLLAEA